ncbi:MAG: hydroxyisourate hydrolase [Pseudomonadota bacterium]
MGRLTTHVLDTARGCPASGIKIELRRVDNGQGDLVATAITNADGRTDAPMLAADAFHTGCYELTFFAGDYFDATGLDLPNPKFLDQVVIRFGLSAQETHYHVPLLLSPFGYSTYRGS